MKITIVAVGNLKESFWREAANEYLKRLAAYAEVAVTEVPEGRVGQDASAGDEARAREREAQCIARAVPQGSVPILLAINGEQRSSEQWADSVESFAHYHFSLGPLTLPHQLARIVLLEQIYRAFRILRNEPYHK